ncbi:MAG: response regulator [Paenibacillaceae bacterium]|jgi:two-component system response regulator YesN|nr:response regulator [Paenibacillaceae bacterium]
MKMIKIVLADDNVMMVEQISRLIPWEQEGFCLAAKAYDGKTALDAIRELGVDILITDIKMPHMDGLELIRHIRSLGLDAKVIVLSSYSDFQLVREALRLGAAEYIMKTELTPPALSKLLEKLKQQLYQERAGMRKLQEREVHLDSYAARLKEMDSELYRNRRQIKDGMLKELCHSYITEERFLAQKKDYLNIRYGEGRHGVYYLCVDNFDKLLTLFWNHNEALLSFAVMNILDEVLQHFVAADVYYHGSGEFVVLLSLDKKAPDVKEADWPQEIFSKWSQELNRYLGVETSAGFSCDNWRTGQQDHRAGRQDALPKGKPVRRLFLDAMKACQYRFALGKGRLILEQEVADKRGAAPVAYNDRVDNLRNALFTANLHYAEDMAQSILVNGEEVTPELFPEVLKLYERYSFLLYDYMEQNHLQAVCGKLLDGFNELLYYRESIPALNRQLQEILAAVSRSMTTGNAMVRQLIQYIHACYDREITVQSAAEHIGVSSAYLGRLIHKELGVSFSDYLNRYRIGLAKDLLKDGRFKIYEAAEKVGYASTEYFSKMFKKYTGATPKDYVMGKYN